MRSAKNVDFFSHVRKPLNEILSYPKDITSVYIVENHIWQNNGDRDARALRMAEPRTVREFLIHPVRSFLNDILRKIAAPYDPDRRDENIGQGYWIQAEFGSGKSHLLSFLGALAIGTDAVWNLVKTKEEEFGMGKRESLYAFYEEGLKRKNTESKGVLVAVKTLVGSGGGGVGLENAQKSLTEHILDAVSEQFALETGVSLPIYPAQILANRFLNEDLKYYKEELGRYLRNPNFFDDEEQEDLNDFIEDLQDTTDPSKQRDCGQKLWNFYKEVLKTTPQIPMDTESVLENMVSEVLLAGYAGLLLILDEVSLYMGARDDQQRKEDESALVVMSNRLTRVKNLPVWTVCAAQQAIESKLAGSKNIIARERLDLVPLLAKADDYYQIALSRVRKIEHPEPIEQYFTDYERGFTWASHQGKDKFNTFFPFYDESMKVLRALSSHLTTVRSALYFMLETIKRQSKNHSNEMISLWSMFEEVVNYSEDPSGTTRSVANIQTKFEREWKAYQQAKYQISSATKGYLKTYPSRCERIVKTLFLYHVTRLAPDGLTHEQIMNSVMEWKDHEHGQKADQQDNLDHYEILLDTLARELIQIEVKNGRFLFVPEGSNGRAPTDEYKRFHDEAEEDENQRLAAWQALLAMRPGSWEVRTSTMILDLSAGVESIFNEIADETPVNPVFSWNKRKIKGRLMMRDLNRLPQGVMSLPNVNTDETEEDFLVVISSQPYPEAVDKIIKPKRDPRILVWVPDELTAAEKARLVDFAAYRMMVAEYRNKGDEEAEKMVQWVRAQLENEIGSMVRMVTEIYGRGTLSSLTHLQLNFSMQGNLVTILTPAITQVLDSTYDSARLAFDFNVDFDDTLAINVINGIIKLGEFPHGVKPGKEVEASRNFGVALEIMKSGREKDRYLDLSGSRYAADLLAWIETKTSELGMPLTMDTLYKNFTGIHGPNDTNYGLSRRMIQLYILGLVRVGKLRVSLTGRNLPVEVIDYANIAGIDFKTNILNAMSHVECLNPPEGWEVIAPFAAVLLGDESLRTVQDEAEIQQGITRLLAWAQDFKPGFAALQKEGEKLFVDLGMENPYAELLQQWERFCQQRLSADHPIDSFRGALETAFAYPLLSEDGYDNDDVDDFRTRFARLEHLRALIAKADELKRLVRYGEAALPAVAVFEPIRRNLAVATANLKQIDILAGNPARLAGECLQPAQEAVDAYGSQYLQAYDRIVQATDEARRAVAALRQSPRYALLRALETVPQLNTRAVQALEGVLSTPALDATLFPANLTRAAVQRDLRSMPQPPNVPLTFENAPRWLEAAEQAEERANTALENALLEKCALLLSPTLHARLAEHAHAPQVARVLAAADAADLLALLLELQAGADFEAWLQDLAGMFRTVRILQLRLGGFRPQHNTYNADQAEVIVAEFRAYVQQTLAQANDGDAEADARADATMIEIVD